MKKNTPINNGYGTTVPPSLRDVKIYFDQKGLSGEAAEGFYEHYKCRKWKTNKGCPIRNWKVTACNWIWLHHQVKPLSIDIKIRLQFPK